MGKIERVGGPNSSLKQDVDELEVAFKRFDSAVFGSDDESTLPLRELCDRVIVGVRLRVQRAREKGEVNKLCADSVRQELMRVHGRSDHHSDVPNLDDRRSPVTRSTVPEIRSVTEEERPQNPPVEEGRVSELLAEVRDSRLKRAARIKSLRILATYPDVPITWAIADLSETDPDLKEVALELLEGREKIDRGTALRIREGVTFEGEMQRKVG